MPAGMFALFCLILMLFLWPLLFMDLMVLALFKLGISPIDGLLIVVCILLGSFINLPVKRYQATTKGSVPIPILFDLHRRLTLQVPEPRVVVIAVNVGGCVIPVVLVIYQLKNLHEAGFLLIAMMASALNIAICYHFSIFRVGVGMVMPAFLPGITAALLGLLLCPEYPSAVAFSAGVLGPLIGADLLKLNKIRRYSLGIISIGGAGTFDGIVISGFIALLLS